jgi:hypothetical protein
LHPAHHKTSLSARRSLMTKVQGKAAGEKKEKAVKA